MITVFKIITESFLQAFQQLRSNKLRSFLSLLGITIGIFCIIGVQSSVDSLEMDIRSSFEKLGSDVIYISRFSWAEDPSQNWWKYRRRPNPDYDDYKAVKRKSNYAELSAFWSVIGARTVKYRSNSVDRAFLFGATYDYVDMFKLGFEKGRYFSLSEYHYGSPKCILGYEVAEKLFNDKDPIGREIKISGKKMEVIGVLEKSGDDLISILNYDETVMVTYEFGKQMANIKRGGFGGGIAVKAYPDASLEEVKDELTIIIRNGRKLKPKEDDNFSLNSLSIIKEGLDSFFSVLNMLGLIIGIFAIFVGAFSVANIMFVSVKERTNIIGIKKALGAKQYVILLEFLIESVILCLIGGLIGLVFVFVSLEILTKVIDFNIYLSLKNVIWGLVWSIGIGIVSGFIPALQASRMNPVDAIRSK